MQENLPQNYNNNFWLKIKNIFRYLFGKKVTQASQTVEEKDGVVNSKKQNIIDEIKEENKKQRNKDEIISQIKSNPKLIESLSEQRLKELIQLLEERHEKNRVTIMKLKKEVEELKKIS